MKDIFNQKIHERDGLRPLSGDEVSRLAAQSNTAADWSSVRVCADGFDAGKIRGCSFDGRVNIGAFTLDYLEYGNVTLKTGLYGSHFRDTDIGDNAAIHNLFYCRGQNIGNSVIILNVCELSTTVDGIDRINESDGGSGIRGNGDCIGGVNSGRNAFGMSVDKNSLHPIHIINENGGRAILINPQMSCTDAYIWAKFRGDKELMDRLSEITLNDNKNLRPPRAIVANNAVIMNVKAIRDTLIGPAAIVDGADLISNSTILSDPAERTVIGASAQIRNSIVGYGNEIDSAAQLDSVMTGTAVALSKSARVTHSFIGDCSRIACCEVAHCLIMPSHGQHHNNSFLIAAATGGQSNIAAGATVGSNHNSRTADGEIWANRGFWPGLCVSLKHNCRFASFTMIAKGSYQAELDIKLPFSLVTQDESGSAAVYPAFWFAHNMYAAMRSAQKFAARDKRVHRRQSIEHDILAPDTVEEMFEALRLLDRKEVAIERGSPDSAPKNADNACNMYRMMIRHYCAKNILPYMRDNGINSLKELLAAVAPLPYDDETWLNCGAIVITKTALSGIIDAIKKGEAAGDGIANAKTAEDDGAGPPPTKKIESWADINRLFDSWTQTYKTAKVRHAVHSLARLEGRLEGAAGELSDAVFAAFLQTVPKDCETIAALTLSSRSKDYSDPFRKMPYNSKEEMDAVLGPISDPVVGQTAGEMYNLALLAIFYQKNQQ